MTDLATPRFAPPTNEVSRRPNPIQRARNVWRYRELLVNLTRKELKVKYKDSVLGFLWSLLNPIMYLVVFSIVFQAILETEVPYFAIFFLSGLLAWTFFATALNAGATSIVANSQLVSKVWFPREILPLAAIGAALAHFALQASVLAGALLLFRRAPSLEYSIALLPAAAVLVVLCAALAIGLSAVNVYMRDTQHLLELVLLAWFWMSAVVYPYRLVVNALSERDLPEWLALLNPMVPLIITFQKAIYNPDTDAVIPDHSLGWYLTGVGAVGAVAVALLFGALWLFGRLEDDLAEEI